MEGVTSPSSAGQSTSTAKGHKMIEVTAAILKAKEFLRDNYSGEQISDVRLEEVVLSEDDGLWHITLSFLRPLRAPTQLTAELDEMSAAKQSERDNKVFAVDTQSGRVQSMKMRPRHGV